MYRLLVTSSHIIPGQLPVPVWLHPPLVTVSSVGTLGQPQQTSNQFTKTTVATLLASTTCESPIALTLFGPSITLHSTSPHHDAKLLPSTDGRRPNRQCRQPIRLCQPSRIPEAAIYTPHGRLVFGRFPIQRRRSGAILVQQASLGIRVGTRRYASRRGTGEQHASCASVGSLTCLSLPQVVYRSKKAHLPGARWTIPVIGKFADSMNPRLENYKKQWASGALSAVSVFNM